MASVTPSIRGLSGAEAVELHDIQNVRDFIDFIAKNQALGALVLTVSAAIAWLFNKYYAYLYWRHTRDTEILENLIAVRTEIALNIESFEKNFTPKTLAQALENAQRMAAARRRQPMITGEAGENPVFEALKLRLTILPTDTIEPVIRYYTLEAEFTASYHSLSNPVLAKRDITITLELIKTTHEDADQCIRQGKATARKLADKIAAIKR